MHRTFQCNCVSFLRVIYCHADCGFLRIHGIVSAGRYNVLPSVVSDHGGVNKPSEEERKASLRFMDFLIRGQLLEVTFTLHAFV